MPAASLLAAVAAEMVINDIGSHDLEKTEKGVLVVAFKFAQGFVVVGAELEVGVLDQIVDQEPVHRAGPAADAFANYSGD